MWNRQLDIQTRNSNKRSGLGNLYLGVFNIWWWLELWLYRRFPTGWEWGARPALGNLTIYWPVEGKQTWKDKKKEQQRLSGHMTPENVVSQKTRKVNIQNSVRIRYIPGWLKIHENIFFLLCPLLLQGINVVSYREVFPMPDNNLTVLSFLEILTLSGVCPSLQ